MSQLGDLRFETRLASTLGMFALSSFWIQPRPTIRAAIQSVSVMMSRPVGLQSASWLRTTPKNSALSLMSVTYSTLIPLSCSNFWRDG